MSEIDADIRGRHLLVIATGQYEDPAWHQLPVADEVRVWTDWLTDDALTDRRFTHLAPDLADNPRFPRLFEFLTSELDQIHSSDALVVVVTGHGTVVDRVHRIVLSDAGQPPLESQSLRSEQLISFLKGTEVEHALVVIDTCHAGEVTRQMLYDKALPAGWIGIAAAAPEGEARAGSVAEAVRAFLNPDPGDERHGGPNQPYFLVSDLVQFITDQLGEDQDVVTFPRQARSRPSPCLPNPAFISAHEGLVGTAIQRQDLALREEDLAVHWGPRARGVQHVGEVGWLFTGRARLMRDLIGVARGQRGTCMITGAAGSGKSAVLARLVTLSDPGFRGRHPDFVAAVPEHVRPERGDVDVAIHARGKTAAEILDRLCTAYDVTLEADDTASGLAQQQQAHIDALMRRIAFLSRDTTIVIDALDEANDPRDVLTNVLVPLATGWNEPIVRLILGVRSADDPLEPGGGGAAPTLVGACRTLLGATELRVDTAPYWSTQDLVNYVGDILTTPVLDGDKTPYTTATHETHAVASRVAQLVGTSYLVAQIVARQLATAETIQDPDDPAWQSMVSTGLSSVLEAELADAFPNPDDRRRALTVLRAASLAFGHGIPWRRIWPAIATAVADDGEDYGDSDIRWLLGHRIGGYLVRELDDDSTTVYRPFHYALTQALALASRQNNWPPNFPAAPPEPGLTTGKLSKEDPDQYLTAQHGNIVHALTALLPASPTDTTVEPDRYLRRHLAEHAAASGRLDDLLENARFLAIADPDALLPLLANTKHPAGLVYRQVAYQLRGRTQQEKIVLLETASHLAGDRNAALQFDHLLPRRPWRVKWAQTSSPSPHIIVTAQQGAVKEVALFQIKGRPLIVTHISGGPVQNWDVFTENTPIDSDNYKAPVQVWDMATGTSVSGLWTEDSGMTSAVAVGYVQGRPVIVSGQYDGTVQVWDLATGTLVGRLVTGVTGWLSAVAVGNAHGRPVIVSGRHDGTVQVWDLVTGSRIREVLTGYTSSIDAVAVKELRGRPVIISIYGGRVQVCDLAIGTFVDSVTHWETSVSAVGDLFGRPVVVSLNDGTPRVWDPGTGKSIGSPTTGHSAWVSAVAVGEVRRRPVIVSGSWYGVIQVHDLATGVRIGHPLTGHTGNVNTVLVGELNGRPVVVSGGNDGTIRVWDLVDDQPLVSSSLRDQIGSVSAVAVGELEGRPVVVSAGRKGAIEVWDLTAGMPLFSIPPTEQFDSVSAVAVGELGGRPVIVSVGEHGTVGVCDLATGTRVDSPPLEPIGIVSAVGVAEVEGQLLIVGGNSEGAIRVWNLTASTWVDSPPTQYTERVAAVAVTQVDGRTLIVSGNENGIVQVWDLAAGTSVDSSATGNTDWISALAVGEVKGQPVIVSGNFEGTIRLWDLSSCTPIDSPLARHAGPVTTVTVAQVNGRPLIVSGSEDHTVRWWDLATGRQLNALPLGGRIGAICARGPSISIGVGNALIVLELDPEIGFPD